MEMWLDDTWVTSVTSFNVFVLFTPTHCFNMDCLLYFSPPYILGYNTRIVKKKKKACSIHVIFSIPLLSNHVENIKSQ